jgi:hypothetical protein
MIVHCNDIIQPQNARTRQMHRVKQWNVGPNKRPTSVSSCERNSKKLSVIFRQGFLTYEDDDKSHIICGWTWLGQESRSETKERLIALKSRLEEVEAALQHRCGNTTHPIASRSVQIVAPCCRPFVVPAGLCPALKDASIAGPWRLRRRCRRRQSAPCR